LSAAEHATTRHNTAAARQPPPRLPNDLARATMVFVRREAMYRRSNRCTTAPTPLFAVLFTTSRCASATGWTRCQPSGSNHSPILLRRPRCPGFGDARPPPYASGTSRRREPWQPAGYTSPPNRQPNRDGNRFPLARRQGFLHAPPLFSTTPPLGPPATAERRQD
jgi:hypothetical protein